MKTARITGHRARPPHEPLSAVGEWRRDVGTRLAALEQVQGDREAQMDARRRRAGLERAVAAVGERLLGKPRRRSHTTRPSAVVVHRHAWMRARLVALLRDSGFAVVGEGEDGAVALGLVLAEQPDVLILEDKLAWVSPRDVLSDASRFAPATAVAVQVEDIGDAESLLKAGAATVVSRAAPLTELVEWAQQAVAEREPATSDRSA